MTSRHTERKYRSSGLNSLNTATHEISQNIGAEKSVPSYDEDSVATEMCVAAITLPVRGIVRELTAGAKIGATETPERLNISPETGPAGIVSMACHVQTTDTAQRWCASWPDWAIKRPSYTLITRTGLASFLSEVNTLILRNLENTNNDRGERVVTRVPAGIIETLPVCWYRKSET